MPRRNHYSRERFAIVRKRGLDGREFLPVHVLKRLSEEKVLAILCC